MNENLIDLYCTDCDKHYKVPKASVDLLLMHKKPLRQEGKKYIYENGCFFKDLARIKQKKS